jgi:hypothetical protein
MIKWFIAFLVLWIVCTLVISCARADYLDNDFMADQIYSVYLERTNHITEADMWLVEYNAELDKSLGIQIDVLCNAWGRSLSQCRMQMLFSTGNEFTPYKSQF